MTSDSDFTSGSPFEGFRFGEFDHLHGLDKAKLIQMIARIAERSYRRGFQHGTLGHHTIDPQKLRFEMPLNESPYTDGPGGHSSVRRLFMECPALKHIGFSE